jgi:hypothetical protein
MASKTEFILVIWPDSQELMDYPWFDKECFLMQGTGDQPHYDASYFVPRERIDEIRSMHPNIHFF